jgi:hypothetical protein
MPSPVVATAAVDVMPRALSSQYAFDERLQALDNLYPDGSSDRVALAQIPRRYFTLSNPVRGALYRAMRAFYFAHIATPFYVYVGRETVPPWSYDPTGQAPDGRYKVAFDSAWSETLALGRSSSDFALREVA